MPPPFKNPLFRAQWLRVAGHASSGGAEIGECYAVADQIRDGDPESWRDGWMKFADRLAQFAEASLRAGRDVSAHEGFLRASNYHRAGYLFDLKPGDGDRLSSGYRLQREAFRASVAARPGWAEAIEIPFEGMNLPAYFFPAHGVKPAPTLIVTGGYDSTAEELYFYSGPAALARGYNVVCYDGPGQGGPLIEQGMVFRPDWEVVLAAVLKTVAKRPEVDPEAVILMGLSFGGYLAPRAATGNDLAALVADPGQFSLLEEFGKRLPGPLGKALPDGSRFMQALIETMLHARLRNATGGWALRRGLLAHGVDGPLDYLKLSAQYTLAGRIDLIRCPTLVASAEADQIGATAPKLYDRLSCPKSYQRFTVAEGAGAHCESGARAVFNQRVFDWCEAYVGGAGRATRSVARAS